MNKLRQYEDPMRDLLIASYEQSRHKTVWPNDIVEPRDYFVSASVFKQVFVIEIKNY